MASASEFSMSDENNSDLIDQFSSVTGASKEEAVEKLQEYDWNLEMAVNMYVDSDFQEDDGTSADQMKNTDNSAGDSDGVRAPILPSRAVLVHQDVGDYYRLRNRKRQREEALGQESASGTSAGGSTKKRRTLDDLFRPPLDMMYRECFESARDLGQASNRWLMVNIQDSKEFSCQVLNRDVWRNQDIKNLITENFVFWQVGIDSIDGQRYMQFYKPIQYPYVAVIDPRTGENLAIWHEVDVAIFSDLVTAFLKEYHLPIDPSEEDVSATASNHPDQVEENQITAALQASLKDEALLAADDDDSDFEMLDSDSESPSSNAPKVNTVSFDSDHSNDTVDAADSKESNNHEDKDDKSWKHFVGSEDDPKTELVIRLPDGRREQITWPCSTKLEALSLYTRELGYDDEFELVTNYPRQHLCKMDLDKSLQDIGLYPSEIIFVQLRD